jgi:hypothetical protein
VGGEDGGGVRESPYAAPGPSNAAPSARIPKSFDAGKVILSPKFLVRVPEHAAQTQESGVFSIFLSLTQVNRSLTDKALRTSLLGVKTGAKPGQTKEMVRDLAFAYVGRSQGSPD